MGHHGHKSEHQRRLRQQRGERAFIFDKDMTKCLANVDREDWEFAISMFGGKIADAAADCGFDGIPAKPGLTSQGLDMAKVSLEYNYRTVVGPDREAVRSSLRVLQSAAAHGREDAGVFLMGYLVSLPDDDWEMRTATVDALQYTRTERCAELLLGELRRVRGSNTTRRYLDKIIDVLRRFPPEAVQDKLEAMAKDTALSPKMRRKLQAAVDESALHGL